MTSADSISLILRRLDEIERKLDRIMEEPGSYGHRLFGTQGQSSKGGLTVQRSKSLAKSNKSPDGVRATKRYQPEGDVGEAKNKHTSPATVE